MSSPGSSSPGGTAFYPALFHSRLLPRQVHAAWCSGIAYESPRLPARPQSAALRCAVRVGRPSQASYHGEGTAPAWRFDGFCGHSVVAIEHDLDVIAEADRVIDLGPDGGKAGGQVVAATTPEGVVKLKTHTGVALKAVFSRM